MSTVEVEPKMKDVFLSSEQIKAMYLNDEISLETLISCLAPGLIWFRTPVKSPEVANEAS